MSGKLKGGSDSEVTRLKEKWAELPEEQRDYWRSRFVSKTTQADLRLELKQKLGVNLLYDPQLTRFRDWVDEQMMEDIEAARQADEERRLKEEHPEWTRDDLRNALIESAYRRARARGDFDLGLKVMKQDRGFMQEFLARETFLRDLDEVLQRLLDKAKELSTSQSSNAEQIAAMRQTFFADVEALAKSGTVKIPKA